MKVIDAHTGKEMVLGMTVKHDGVSRTLLQIEPGILSARAQVLMVYRDHSQPGGPMINRDEWVPLQVRWTHPMYFLQHVAFFPS
jgi:hypothetical protein